MTAPTQQTPADEQTKRSALIVATISSFVTPFMGSSINIALPAIQQDLQIDAVLLSWLATAYLLTAAVCLVPFGRLADIHGRKKMYMAGISIFTLGSLLSGLSVNSTMLLLTRIFSGVGSAMIFGTGIAILSSVFPPDERGRVFGITVAAVYAGLSLGPFAGGLLTQHLGWRSIFLVNVPIGFSVIPLILLKLKGEWADARGEKFDLVGSLIYGPSVIGIVYGMTIMPEALGFWLLGAGLLGLTVFATWESRQEHPVFQTRLFSSNRTFAFSNLAALIHYASTFGVTFLLSLYLQYLKGLTPQAAGTVLVAQPVMMALFSPLAGKLSDRIEPRIVASLGMAITALSLAALTIVDGSTALWYIIAVLSILGFGYALFSSPNMNAIMGSVERRYYGIASGSVGTMRLFGQMISMSITTLIFTLLIGRVQITPEYYPVFQTCVKSALTTFSILCGIGVIASLARGRIRK